MKFNYSLFMTYKYTDQMVIEFHRVDSPLFVKGRGRRRRRLSENVYYFCENVV